MAPYGGEKAKLSQHCESVSKSETFGTDEIFTTFWQKSPIPGTLFHSILCNMFCVALMFAFMGGCWVLVYVYIEYFFQ